MFALLRGIGRQIGRNLARGWLTQLLGLITVMLAVLVFAFFLLLYINAQEIGERLGQNIQLTLYLEQEIEEPLRRRLQERIHQFGEIEEVRYVSSRQAFERFRRQLGAESELLAELEPGILPPSLEVVPAPGLRGAADLERLAEFLLTLPDSDRVRYGQQWLRNFTAFNRLLQAVVLVSGVLLLLNLIFTIAYTTRLTLATRRDEIELMRLLGADRSYITLPFATEALLQSGLGAGLGLGGLYLLFSRGGQTLALETMLPGLLSPSFLGPEIISAIIAGALLLGTVSSLLVVNKVLREL
ncbi:MAG: permease-like cell division protein FtsX [Desulfurivibrio sp.]|nr:permease-like cell division protein FtsX [Desulfurivibrio sp.]